MRKQKTASCIIQKAAISKVYIGGCCPISVNSASESRYSPSVYEKRMIYGCTASGKQADRFCVSKEKSF